MTRYRVQLVPQGAIPQAMNIGVRLTPIGVPPPQAVRPPLPAPCLPECLSISVVGWTSSAGEASTVSGTNDAPVAMEGGPWTVQLFVNEVVPSSPVLCGKTLTWVFTGDLIEGTDYRVGFGANNLWLFGMKGCDPPYSGTAIIQPQLDGEDFCDPLTLSFSGEGGGCGGGSGCCFTSDFGDPCLSGAINLGSSFPSYTITDIGANAGGSPLFWTLTNVGTPVAIDPDISGDGTTYTISYDGVTDIFGAVWIVQGYLDEELTMPYCDVQVIVSGIS